MPNTMYCGWVPLRLSDSDHVPQFCLNDHKRCFRCMNHRQSTHHSAFDKPVELHWWTCGDKVIGYDRTRTRDPLILGRIQRIEEVSWTTSWFSRRRRRKVEQHLFNPARIGFQGFTVDWCWIVLWYHWHSTSNVDCTIIKAYPTSYTHSRAEIHANVSKYYVIHTSNIQILLFDSNNKGKVESVDHVMV
jgi:hypothetical protein